MSYNIKEIEGIGPAFTEKLEGVGIKTTDDLLGACKTPAMRTELAEKAGFETRTLLDWANKADLMRISGIGEEYSDLLEAAGVDTVKELATRNVENLLEKVEEVNNEKNLVRALPRLDQLQDWIDEAKKTDPILEY